MSVNIPQSERPQGTLGRFALPSAGIGLALVVAIVVAFLIRGSGVPDSLNQALVALQRGDKPAAIASFRTHLLEAPDSVSTRLRLAALLHKQSPDEALEILSRIPKSDPEWVTAIQQTAVIQLLAKRNAAAEQSLQELLAVQPQHFGAQLSLAELYFNRKDFQAALSHAQEAARLVPDRAQTFLLVAEIYDELHNQAAMVEPLQSALAIDPELYAAHLNLAYAHHSLGQLAEAETQAQWCLKVNPREVAALRILASSARAEGRFDDAETWLAKALAIQPHDVDSRILEADLLLYRRKPREAYERLKELSESHQTTVRFLGALARAATSAGEREEARKHYQAMEQLVQKSRTPPP